MAVEKFKTVLPPKDFLDGTIWCQGDRTISTQSVNKKVKKGKNWGLTLFDMWWVNSYSIVADRSDIFICAKSWLLMRTQNFAKSYKFSISHYSHYSKRMMYRIFYSFWNIWMILKQLEFRFNPVHNLSLAK